MATNDSTNLSNQLSSGLSQILLNATNATTVTTAADSIMLNDTNNVTEKTLQLTLYSNHRRYLVGGILLAIGVIGNFLALIILSRKKATKNSKYTLMLRCLSTNNLISLLGMLSTLLLKIYVPEDTYKQYIRLDCAGKVLWRFFGLSSGCIAAVMAIERWMALARPFIYHKHITYELIRKAINSLVFIAIFITFLPYFGFGAYIDDSDPTNVRCIRYRDAEGFWNKSYSVLFMIFGTLLCVVIVACNLFVTRVLCFIGRTRSTKRHIKHYDLVNREAGSSSHRFENDSNSGTLLYNCHNTLPNQNNNHHYGTSVNMPAATSPDEIKFAKLMTFLSISFVICWMPQMISIPMAILPNRVPPTHTFFVIADVLMALHFTSDPYIYVLSRSRSFGAFNCIKRWGYGLRRSQSDQSRLRATIDQHTVHCGLT